MLIQRMQRKEQQSKINAIYEKKLRPDTMLVERYPQSIEYVCKAIIWIQPSGGF